MTGAKGAIMLANHKAGCFNFVPPLPLMPTQPTPPIYSVLRLELMRKLHVEVGVVNKMGVASLATRAHTTNSPFHKS